MITRRNTYNLIFILFISINAIAQDTTLFEPKVNYYSNNGDLSRFEKKKKTKHFPNVNYAKEVIAFENDSFIVENCYYLDNKRYVGKNTIHYKLINNSILIAENEKWNFEKLNDSIYSITRKSNEFIEKGYAISLVPLIKEGKFKIFNKNNKLLVIEHYHKDKLIKVESPTIELEDTIYEYTNVEIKPIFPSKYGDLKEYISKRYIYPEIAVESSIQGYIYVKFVVSSSGKVVNIEIVRGINPYANKEAIKVVANLPNFEPGKINNKNVNTYYTVAVKFILR